MLKWAACLGAIACVTMACSFRIWIVVINNTGTTVEVSNPPQRDTIAPGGVGQVHYGDLKVFSKGCTARYRLPMLADLLEYEARATTHVYVQLQSDGVLYLLPAETHTPLADVSGARIRVAPTDTRCKAP